jgi:hypothetical protein
MIAFPDSTKVGRAIPKNAFYKHLEVNTRMKRIFVNDVDRIIWAYKFAPSTLNVSDGKNVHEITVFSITLKTRECPTDMFVFIDKNIPRHTVFILSYDDDACVVINYKEETPSNNGQTYKVSKTYQSQWTSKDAVSLTLEGTTMDSIYENMVRQIAGEQLSEVTSSLKEDILLSQQQEKLRKEIATIKKRLSAENQPQRKFALHKKLKELEKQLK